jgi:hypothetical protein
MPVIKISHHGGNVRASVRRPAAMEIMRAPSGCGYPAGDALTIPGLKKEPAVRC